MRSPDYAMVVAQREANDPHRFYPNGLCYCSVSRRTEGTRRMEGITCSYCMFRNPMVAAP
jgi:hypothetical protein